MNFSEYFDYDYFNNFSKYYTSDTCIYNLLPANFDLYRFYFIGMYSVLFLLAFSENTNALFSLIKTRYRNRGTKLLLLNLTIANMLITFVNIPIEIIWRFTFIWPIGEMGCKVVQPIRALGPYSTSWILVAISIDRYLVLTRPLRGQNSTNVIVMLCLAWIASVCLCIPQSIVFSLQSHPSCRAFIQCVPFNYFSEEWQLTMYSILCLSAAYLIPMFIILYCYSVIVWSLRRDKRELRGLQETTQKRNLTTNWSQEEGYQTTVDKRNRKAYIKTIKRSLVIIIAFITCWTPYIVFILWKELNPVSFGNINPYISDTILLLAVSNACINPIVYGTHSSLLSKLWQKVCLCKRSQVDRPLPRVSSGIHSRFSTRTFSHQHDD